MRKTPATNAARNIFYSHFKPNKNGGIGGAMWPITKNEARRIIKTKNLKYDKKEEWEHEKGRRNFSNGREKIFIYTS